MRRSFFGIGIFALATLLCPLTGQCAPAGADRDDKTTDVAQHPALVPASKKGKWHEAHESFLKRGKEGPIGVLFLGDSITRAWATSGSKVWEKHYADLKPANFGIGGDRTQNVLWRIENGELDGISPKVVVLMIGTNNSNTDEAEPIIAGVKRVITEIHAKLPTTKVLLLSIFPRNAKRDLPDNVPMQRVRKVNEAISKLDDGKTIRFLDVTDKFLPPGQDKVPADVMPDGVHLTEKGYQIWAEAMDPLLKEMLAE